MTFSKEEQMRKARGVCKSCWYLLKHHQTVKKRDCSCSCNGKQVK